MPVKVSRSKTSAALVQELRGEDAYANPKAITATLAFLRRVVFLCSKYNQNFAQIPATKIKEQFDNVGVNYKPCLVALERKGIIAVDMKYVVGAKTRGYKLTTKGIELMTTTALSLLHSLIKDPEVKRQLQKRASYYKTKAKKQYRDGFLQYISAGLRGYTFDEHAINAIQGSDWNPLTKLDALESLVDFSERHFVELEFNESDQRVWNEFVGMKSELRKYFSLGKLRYRFVMDIRSCHPLFLAHFLVHEARPKEWMTKNPMMPGDHQNTIVQNDRRKRERSESLSFTTSTPIQSPNISSSNSPNSGNQGTTTTNNNSVPHYVGGNSDISAELKKWNAIFCHPAKDPKTVLIRELGYTREQAKAALNHSINGSQQYRKFVTWFNKKFPLLHSVWERTRIKLVGNEISCHHETTLMQDMALYRLADKLGLHLTYEYDGCGVMCREDDADALTKIAQLIQHVQEHSQRRWNICPVIVVKTAAGEPVALPAPTTGKTERPKATTKPKAAVLANHTAASASQRSPNRSSRLGHKRRG